MDNFLNNLENSHALHWTLMRWFGIAIVAPFIGAYLLFTELPIWLWKSGINIVTYYKVLFKGPKFHLGDLVRHQYMSEEDKDPMAIEKIKFEDGRYFYYVEGYTYYSEAFYTKYEAPNYDNY